MLYLSNSWCGVGANEKHVSHCHQLTCRAQGEWKGAVFPLPTRTATLTAKCKPSKSDRWHGVFTFRWAKLVPSTSYPDLGSYHEFMIELRCHAHDQFSCKKFTGYHGPMGINDHSWPPCLATEYVIHMMWIHQQQDSSLLIEITWTRKYPSWWNSIMLIEDIFSTMATFRRTYKNNSRCFPLKRNKSSRRPFKV